MLPLMHISLCLKLCVAILDIYVTARQYRRHHPAYRPSPRVAAFVPIAYFVRSQHFHRLRAAFRLRATAFEALLDAIANLSHVFPHVWRPAVALAPFSPLAQTVLFAAALAILSTLLDLPLALYATSLLRASSASTSSASASNTSSTSSTTSSHSPSGISGEKNSNVRATSAQSPAPTSTATAATEAETFDTSGLDPQIATIRAFLQDTRISAVLGLPFVVALHYLLQFAVAVGPHTAAILAATAVCVWRLLQTYLLPALIAPSLLGLTPLSDELLREKVVKLAHRLDLPVHHVYATSPVPITAQSFPLSATEPPLPNTTPLRTTGSGTPATTTATATLGYVVGDTSNDHPTVLASALDHSHDSSSAVAASAFGGPGGTSGCWYSSTCRFPPFATKTNASRSRPRSRARFRSTLTPTELPRNFPSTTTTSSDAMQTFATTSTNATEGMVPTTAKPSPGTGKAAGKAVAFSEAALLLTTKTSKFIPSSSMTSVPPEQSGGTISCDPLHAHAAVIGVAPRRSVCISNTLLRAAGHHHDVVLAVVCHELAHRRHGHTAVLTAKTAVHACLVAALYAVASGHPDLYRSFGFAEGEIVAPLVSAVLVNCLLSPLDDLLTPMQHVISRRIEFQADAFVKRHGLGQALGDALCLLSMSRSMCMSPDPLYSVWNYSRPTLIERFNALGIAPRAKLSATTDN